MNDLPEFRALGVADDLIPALLAKNFVTPSTIQQLAIPLLLSGEKDLIGQALTGTGKTAAFGLPVIQTIAPGKTPQALIIAPTRELSIQISDELRSLAGEKTLKIIPVFGGQPIQIQLDALKRGADIIVGTPGRIMDLYRREKLVLDKLQFAILDEADEMLDMGFIDDIREILSVTNPDKRMLMFSATMPPEIMDVAGQFMRPGYEIARAGGESSTNTSLTEQYFHEVKREFKLDALMRLIDANVELYAMVFCRTRADVDEVTEKLHVKGYRVEALHGEISQAQRLRVINSFKKRKFPILIATDVAARGIDVNDLTHVINYSLPQNAEIYIHRIGRTGRAGRHGVAVSFVTPGERRKLKFIEKDIGNPIPQKKLPEIADIIEAKKQLFAENIALLLENGDADAYLNFAEELCTLGSHPAEAMAAMLKMHFKNELLPESYHEFGKSCRPDESGMKKLLLFAGRADGITVPELLRTICDKTGIRSNQLGKIICRTDKTFINAAPADAEKILKAFAKDSNWHFKYDEPREMRAAKKESGRKKTDSPQEGKSAKTGKEKKKKVKTHKPLREEFFKWIAESEEN
ncbi:MAG: DEAD/DEAH box helicase [Lentisphaeria bacterium]|nr:DEAD/DEAH box helicase [Lentisphaeria bacterium]